jgi:hypothetical protein
MWRVLEVDSSAFWRDAAGAAGATFATAAGGAGDGFDRSRFGGAVVGRALVDGVDVAERADSGANARATALRASVGT